MKYDDSSKESLASELLLRDSLDREREVSDRKYAIKLVEKTLFGLIALIVVTVLGAIISSALK